MLRHRDSATAIVALTLNPLNPKLGSMILSQVPTPLVGITKECAVHTLMLVAFGGGGGKIDLM